MKKIFLFTCLLTIAVAGHSQSMTQDKMIDSLSKIIADLTTKLNFQYYTMVPNQKFDQDVDNKIKSDINSRWTTFIAWFGGIGGVFFIFIFTYMRKEQNANIEKETKRQLEDRQKELKDSLPKEISHVYLTTVKDQYEKQMREMEDSYRKMISQVDDKIREIESFRSEIDNIMQASKVNFMRQEIYRIGQGGTYTKDEFTQLKNYLPEIEKLNNKTLLADAVNELTRAAYYNLRVDDVLDSMDKYFRDPDLEIKENSFINIASGIFYTYATTKEDELKEKGFQYINKSLGKVSDYGEAFGLKLEFLMVDLEKAATDQDKLRIRHEVDLAFSQIFASSYAPKETLARFQRVVTNATEKKYIDLLDKEFPVQLAKLRGGTGEPSTGASSNV